MSFYSSNVGDLPMPSDVNQFTNVFNGTHDIGLINLAPILSVPSSSSFSLTAQSGGSLGVGSYSYQITYVTGQYKTNNTLQKTGETTVSSSLSITTTTTNKSVGINLPTTGLPTSAIAFNIYRTSVGGSDYKLITTVKVGNANYTDTMADTSRGSAPPTVNTTGTTLRMPAQTSFVALPLSMSNVAANVETTINYNGVNFNSGIFTAPQTGNYMFIANLYLNVTNGEVIMWFYVNGSPLYVLDKYKNPTTTIAEYVMHGPILFGLNAGDTVKFTIQTTSTTGSDINQSHSPCSVYKVF